MTRRVTLCAALAAGLFTTVVLLGGRAAAAPVPKDDNKSWVGRTVLPKKSDPFAVYKDPPAGRPRPQKPDGTPGEVPGSLRAASWEVKSEKGTRVEVFEDGVAYWVEKEELVLLSDAIAFFTKAIKADELDAYAYNFRGWAAHLLGKRDDAVKDFGKFLELVPADANGHRVVALSNRGLVLAEQGKFDEALKDLDEAVKFGHALAQLNRGWVYELKGDYKKAADDFTALLQRRPADALALNNLAWLRATCPDAEHRDGAEAVRLATEVCDLTGNREGMYMDTLAAAHAEAGDFAAAVQAQEKALEDAGYVRKSGEEAQKRLQLYKDKKPYRTTPPK
jgi:tetratricopeptide (TPR) repeat protein